VDGKKIARLLLFDLWGGGVLTWLLVFDLGAGLGVRAEVRAGLRAGARACVLVRLLVLDLLAGAEAGTRVLVRSHRLWSRKLVAVKRNDCSKIGV
jgi:hypothetical protein